MPHDSGGVLFHAVCPCVCPSVVRPIFTKLGMCIDIVVISRIANKQVSSIFDRITCQPHDSGGA